MAEKYKLKIIDKRQKASFEIDYDKLADAIVKAELKAKTEKEQTERNKKAGKLFHFSAVAYVLFIITFLALSVLLLIINDNNRAFAMILLSGIMGLFLYIQYIIHIDGGADRMLNAITLITALVSLIFSVMKVA